MSTKRKLPPFPDGTVNRSPQPKKRRVDSPATVRTPATPQSSPRTAKTKRAFTIRFTATAQNQSTIANERVFTIPIAPKRPFKMGRDPDTCEMLFAADTPMISRVHCQFMMGDASNNHQLFVKDFESTNGVFVNGHQIDKFGALKEVNEGDTVRFGRVIRSFNHSYCVSIVAASPTATSTATSTATATTPNGNGKEQLSPNTNTGNTLNTTANVTANATHDNNDHRRSSASFEDLESVLSKALDKRMMAYNAQMEEKLAAKDEENGRMKQLLYEKEMAELKQQTEQQKLEWEQKQHAIEEQMREKEELARTQLQQIEENHKQQAMDLQKMKALEEAAKTKEMENERKLQEIAETQKKQEEERRKEWEQKQHAIEEQMREKEELARTLKAEKEQIEQQQLQQIEENHKQQAMDLQKMKALEEAAKTKEVENERKLQEIAETQKKQEEERRKESEELQRQKEEMEEETTCCMCFELLMKAHSLECGHTMCHQCIREWIDSNVNSNAVCPICRAEIKTEPTPCRTLDNLIESLHIKHKSEAARAEWDNRKKEYGEWKKTYQEAQKQKQQQQQQNHSNPVQAVPVVPVAAAAAFSWPVPVPVVPVVPMPIPPPPPPAQVVLPSTYSIERARSGRSTCRGCWARIDHNSLRFAVHTGADPTQDVYYDSTHYYHPHCYGARFRNEPQARDRRNISNHASVFSTRELDALLLRIFTASNNQAAAGNNEDEDDVVVLPNPNRNQNVNANAGNRNANASSRQFMIDGINFRTRLNRLEHLTMPQLKKYCERNRVQGFNSLRKSALCAMIRRDINQHVGNR